MPAPGSVESGASPGLFVSLRTFWSALISILHTRLDLLTLELEEEATRAVQLLVLSLAALLCISMAFFFLSLFVIAFFWYTHRLLVLGLVFGVYLLASVILLLVVRYMIQNRPKFLSHTIAELHRDMESLRPPPPAAAKTETKL